MLFTSKNKIVRDGISNTIIVDNCPLVFGESLTEFEEKLVKHDGWKWKG